MELEFAPEYSAKERLHKLAVTFPMALGIGAAFKWWLLPLFDRFAAHAHCQTVFGIPGEAVLFYGIFTGAPIALAIVIFLMTIRYSLKAIRTRRYPPEDEKVFRRIKVRRGWAAVVTASAPMMMALYLVGLAVWGYGPATELITKGQSRPREWNCAADLKAALNMSANASLASRLSRHYVS